MITSSSSPQTPLQCLLNPAVRSVARRRAAPLLAALGLGSKRGDHGDDQEDHDADREDHDADQEEDDSDQEEDDADQEDHDADREEDDVDQEEDDADQEEDAWNTFMYFDVIVFLMTILQASTGRPKWKSNLVKPQMFPSVFQTVFPPVEI